MRISDWSSDVCSSDLSLNNGVLRDIARGPKGADKSVRLLSNYFDAVKRAFPDAWHGQTPASSRLLHGVGIQAMGDVMEVLAERADARSVDDFYEGLLCLQDRTAWTDGDRSEEHTSELQSLMRISYAVFCFKKKRIMNTSILHRTMRLDRYT